MTDTTTMTGSPSEVNLLKTLAVLTGAILTGLTIGQIWEETRLNPMLLVALWVSFITWGLVVTQTPNNESLAEQVWAWINLAGVILLVAIALTDFSVDFDGVEFAWPSWMFFILLVAATLGILAWHYGIAWFWAVLGVVVAVAVVWGVSWFFGISDDFEGAISGNGGAAGLAAVEHDNASALNIDCGGAAIVNGPPFIARSPNLVFPASGPSMLGLDAQELTDEFCARMAEDETWRAFVPGALVPDLVLYVDSSAPRLLDKWPDALAESDSLSVEVFSRLSAVAFDFEWVSQDALGGEDYKILTILPAENQDRPVIATSRFKMPVNGMNLWKVTPVAYGDSPLDEVSASFFEPSLGIFFIPSGVDLGVSELEGEIDLGEIFGNEEKAGEALGTTSTSEAQTGTTEAPTGTTEAPTGTTEAPGTTVPAPGTTVPSPGTTVPSPGTTVPGPGTTVPTPTTTCPGCGGGTTTIVPQVTTTTCPGCGVTTTTAPVTTTTLPPTTTTTTQPPTTTTTTTTQPPTTTTTTQPAQKVDFKIRIVSAGENLWKVILRPGSPITGCISSYSPPLGTVFDASAPNYGGMTFVPSTGKLMVRVTGIGCDGWLNNTLNTNEVDPPGGGY